MTAVVFVRLLHLSLSLLAKVRNRAMARVRGERAHLVHLMLGMLMAKSSKLKNIYHLKVQWSTVHFRQEDWVLINKISEPIHTYDWCLRYSCMIHSHMWSQNSPFQLPRAHTTMGGTNSPFQPFTNTAYPNELIASV